MSRLLTISIYYQCMIIVGLYAYEVPQNVLTTESGIPKVIHQIWIGKELPPILDRYMSTFRNMEGYSYYLWRNEDLNEENFPKTWKYLEALLHKPKIVYAMIADLMRLEILYHHGGVYVDTSMEALKNLDVILENASDAFFIMSNEAYGGLSCESHGKKYISNSFIVSVPGYIVLERLISEKYLSGIDFSQPANYATGPYYVRSGILKDSEVTLLPTDLIYPFNYIDEEATEAFFQCFSHEEREGFEKLNYFETPYFIKFPCTAYPHAVMVKNFEIGGTWKK